MVLPPEVAPLLLAPGGTITEHERKFGFASRPGEGRCLAYNGERRVTSRTCQIATQEGRIMQGKRKAAALGIVVLLVAVAGAWFRAANKAQEQPRDRALKAYNDGNYKDAYEIVSKLALDPRDDPMQVAKDLELAVECQRRLDNLDEIDDFREAVIAAHAKNWR